MKELKKYTALVGFILILVLGFFWFGQTSYQEREYGVFIGMEREELLELANPYDSLVLDANYLEKSDIRQLKEKSQQIFAYLNVGALEKSNSFYEDFKDLTFKPYDNWPDEAWLDVTNAAWQDFLVDNLAQDLKNKGVDGLFLDNFDVYDHDHRLVVYDSLLQLLQRFKELDLTIIVNGGSTFVSQLVDENPELAQNLIYAVNQESVFLAYDFDKNKTKKQETMDKNFYLEYLEKVSQARIQVFIIEYGASTTERSDILKQCQDLGYTVYFSPNILLDKE